MPKLALAAALPLLLLAACSSRDQDSERNGAAEAGANAADSNAADSASPSGPAPPDLPDVNGAEPVPPPDAVSHPDGYLPPAPDDSGSTNLGSSDPDESPPATEDEYIRNRQAGR